MSILLVESIKRHLSGQTLNYLNIAIHSVAAIVVPVLLNKKG